MQNFVVTLNRNMMLIWKLDNKLTLIKELWYIYWSLIKNHNMQISQTSFSYLYPLKTFLWFSEVFRRYCLARKVDKDRIKSSIHDHCVIYFMSICVFLKKMTMHLSISIGVKGSGQISLLILRKFKRIKLLIFPLKS